MDDRRFDELTRFLGVSVSRKRFLAFVTGIVAPVALVDGIADVDAKNKKKAKKRRRARQDDGVGSQGNGNGTCGSACDPNEPDQCLNCSPQGVCIGVVVAGVGAEGEPPTGRCAARCTEFCDFSNGDPCDFLGQGDNCICIGNSFEATTEGLPEGCFCFDGCRCEGSCSKKKSECPDVPGCVCDDTFEEPGVCTTCPGACENNPQCTEQGADDCVCFFGSGVDVTDVSIEGLAGRCGTCLANGQRCNASTECCGQLVCLNGTCQQKPPEPKPRPKRERRCHKHGQSCTGDNNCCGQGICFGGKCGEKDTHCDHDNECARGFVCVGGRDTGGHRRCRRRGRNVRRKKNRG
jgi:hypothetical protein